jgi:acetylornithine deacetylase/succinyl-diaminopimelate desuccinylase-like protein
MPADVSAPPHLRAWLEQRLDEHLAELTALCAQPSVSTRDEGVRECAGLVAEMLRRRGFAVELLETDGFPVVLGELGDGERALLLYNHYDVQPPEPLELWDTPPFEPAVRDGAFFARGAIDDKGHIVSRLAALDAYRAAYGEPPFRIVFLIEGEEEIGSPHLPEVLARHADRLRADGCIWEVGGVDLAGRPASDLGLRGMVAVDLSVRTAHADAHSGEQGHLPNAAWRLVWALASLKDPSERVAIPGFLDGAVEPSARQLELLDALPLDEAAQREHYGVRAFAGDRTGLALKRAVLSPTCTINGLWSGYQGEGSMAIIPAEAHAKLDFRLVPGQDPDAVVRALRAHLDAGGFQDVELAVVDEVLHGVAVDPDHPFVALCTRAIEEVYGVAPVLHPWAGGSGPMHPFVDLLGVAPVDVGIFHPGSRAHAPNENFRLADWLTGTEAMARILHAFESYDPR